jgi:hypothetical protein
MKPQVRSLFFVSALLVQKIRVFFDSRQKICTKSYVELKGYVEGTLPYVYVPIRIELSPSDLDRGISVTNRTSLRIPDG